MIVAAKESPSVMMLLGSAFMAFCAWVHSWWSWLLELGGYLIGAGARCRRSCRDVCRRNSDGG